MVDVCRMRLQEYNDIGGGILEELPAEIKRSRPKLLKLHFTGTTTTSLTEISAPTNVLGAATAVGIETISSSALDNLTATADAQKIKVIHINDLNRIITTELLGHPTDWTTFVLHSAIFKEVFHAYCSAWGTNDKDNAGQINVRNIADTVLVSIGAAANESNGGRFRVPDGHVAMLFGGKLRRVTTSGVWANDEGIKIQIVYIDPIDGQTGLVAGDRHLNYLEFIIAGQYGRQEIDIPKGHMFESGSWISVWQGWIVDGGENYDLTLDFLIWKK